MTPQEFLPEEVCIRLADDELAFVCTIRYGGFLAHSKRFPVHVFESKAKVIRADRYLDRDTDS